MTVRHTNPILPAIVFAGAILVLFCVCGRGEATYIRETFYNFDMTLPLDAGSAADEVGINLEGIAPEDILTTYTGELSRGWTPTVKAVPGGVSVFWSAPEGEFLRPGEFIHLGLMLRSGAPPVTAAKGGWYFEGSLGLVIPLVWQNWEGHADSAVGAILLPPSEFPPATQTIATSMIGAPSPNVFPLDLLTRDNESLGQLQWDLTPRFNDFNITSPPAEQLFPSPPADAKAVLTRYGVWERPFIQQQDRRILFTNEAHIVQSPNPQPFLLPPVDFLGERPNLVFGTVDLFATERTGLWDDKIQQTTFDFSEDGGQTWHLIGTDDDGDIPTEATLPSPRAHNWWYTTWDVSQLTEGPKLVRATMFDNEQNEGQNTIEVYVDPTPPIPILENLTEHQVFQKETQLSARTLDEDIVSTIWEVQLKRLYYIKGIPHLDQQDYGKGKVNNGNMYCAPTAAAACLKWWANNGYPELTQDPAGNGLTDTQLVEGLAAAVGTSSVSGTAVPNLVSGLRNWLNNRGLGLTVTGPSAVTPTSIRNEVENCKEDVLIGVYWNTGGGHRVTINSIANYTNADGSTTIDLMDPWEGGIVNITMQPNGDITWPDKAGVQTSGNMVTVSPTKPRIPWIFIGEGPTVSWHPTTLQPGLYFLRCTMTDGMGNRGSSQIAARVGSPFLAPLLDPPRLDLTGKTLMLQWQEVEAGPPFEYAVEFTEDHLKWTRVTDPSQQMSATFTLPAVQKGYYRIWKGPLQ